MTNIVVKILVEVLSVLALATKQIKQGRCLKFVKKLLGESEIETVLQRLDRLTQEEARMTGAQTLEVVHGLVNNMKVVMNDGKTSINDIRHALVEMQEATNETNKMKREQLQEKVRSWLSPPDSSENHVISRRHHRRGTATWLTRDRIFEEWKMGGSLLWIHGKPGSGKSILCSTIIEEAQAISDAGLGLMGYYYFDFRDKAKQDVRGLLTSLLGQLSAKSDSCYKILSELYSRHNAGSRQPVDDALKQCLIDMLKVEGQLVTYIIVDGLDECPNRGVVSSRKRILDLLEELVDLRLPNLRLCTTSRPEADIITAFGPLAFHNVSLHDQSGQKNDISDYIKFVVYSDRKMLKWRMEDKKLVIDTLVRKADGMFRWVVCQLDTLCECIPASLRSVLDELPETLDSTYERILLGIERRNREYALRLLQCLTVAVRPLRVTELAEVLDFRFESGKTPEYRADWRMENAQEAVLSTCSSLIAIINLDGNQVVQFSHFSVKEFLISDRLANAEENLSLYHTLPHSAHSILAQACLGALLRLDDQVDKDRMKDFPLSIYAAQHWVDHGQFKDVSLSIHELMECLFNPDKPHFAIWVWIYNVDQPWDWARHMSSEHPTRPEAVPLYYATLCGFHSLVEHLVISCPSDVNARGGTHHTPLYAALAKGYFDIALLLLEHGADVTFLDRDGLSPLHKASYSGRRDIVEFLLERHGDADMGNGEGETVSDAASRNGACEVARVSLRYGAVVDSRGLKGWTPLMSASRCGHLEIVQLLLQNGAAVDSPNNERPTPLMSASRYGHLEIVHLLLQNGAAVGSTDNQGWTPLMSASRWGYLEIVQLLLQNGAAVDSTDDEGWTPLMSASGCGHLEIVQLLLQTGAAVDPPNNKGWTPLLSASVGHLEIVQLLLQNGVAVDSPNNQAWTPLMSASRYGHLEIVQLLLQNGAAVDSRNNRGWMPLMSASRYGHLEIVQLLLQNGAVVDSPNNEGWTPLMSASRYGHLEIVWLLLQNGATVDFPNNKGWTPLLSASRYGHLEIVQLLLQNGAAVDSPDDEGWVPLMSASGSGHLEIVQLLLQNGAAVDSPTNKGWTPLMSASAWGHLDIVQELLGHGAAVDMNADNGETALYLASHIGRTKVARLLIESGADPNSPTNDGSIPCHAASSNGHLDIVKFLLESGADVNIRNGNKETPLDVAPRNGKHQVTRFLAEHMGIGDVGSWASLDITTPDTISEVMHSDVVESSLSGDENANAVHNGRISLYTASEEGRLDMVWSLLSCGADVNERGAFYSTPLHVALVEGRLEVAEMLIEHGADVTFQDKDGWTPLHCASLYGNLNIARLLLDQGADVNARKLDHWTPLHLASTHGYLEIVKLLLARGANVQVHNDVGWTPFQTALTSGERKIAELLSEYGAH